MEKPPNLFFMQTILQLIRHLPPGLATALLAVVPFTEVRAAVPIGMQFFHLAPAQAVFFACLGSLIPMPFVFWLLPPFLQFIEQHFPALHRFLEHHVRQLEHKHRASYDRFGALAIFLFIALPIPGSGVWSASILAVVFGIRRPLAAFAIICGITTASLLVLAVTLGIVHFV